MKAVVYKGAVDVAVETVADPRIVSHELPLEVAPDAYKNFDQRTDGWTKALLKPGLKVA